MRVSGVGRAAMSDHDNFLYTGGVPSNGPPQPADFLWGG